MQQATAVFDDMGGRYDPDLYRFERTATMVPDFASIGPAEIARYRAEGYLAIAQAFSPTETADALDGLLALIAGEVPGFTGIQFERHARQRLAQLSTEQKQDYVRKLMDFVPHETRLQTLAHHPALLALLRQIVGGPPTLFQDMALLKPPGGGREKPWHQDKAFFTLKLNSPVVGVWIALDPATAENGCMHVIPGSHLEGPVIHFKRRDWQICDTDVQSTRDVIVPLAPGGCLLFDGLIHHGTPANDTSQRRRAVQFHYTHPDAIWTDQSERLAIFGSEGKDVTC